MSKNVINIGGNVGGSNVIIAGDGNVRNVNVRKQSDKNDVGQNRNHSPEKIRDSASAISDKKPLIFLCHAKEDSHAVRNLYYELENSGYKPWMDEIDLLAGQDWDFEIKQTMKHTDFVLVCVSKLSVLKRGYLNKEIKWALDRQDEMPQGEIFTIPVKLDDCEPPPHLSHIHFVELFAPGGFEKITKSLDRQWGKTAPSANTAEKKLTGENPFYFGGAVPAHLFCGRAEILQALLTRIGGKTLQSVSIVGERRMGKSSLLHYVKNELVRQLPQNCRYLVIYLDLMKAYCHTRKELMQVLRRELTKEGVRSWTESQDGELAAFDFALDDLQAENVRVILCLDEIENLTKRPAEFDDLLEDWRACGQMGQMAMITASADTLADLCKQHGLTSPFFNIFSQNYVNLLETAEWQALITKNMPATPEDLRFVEETAGGHPFFTQMAASYLWDMKTRGAANHEQLKNRLKEEMRGHLEYLWVHLSEPEKAALRFFSGKTSAKPAENVSYRLGLRGILRNDKLFCLPFAEFVEEM